MKKQRHLGLDHLKGDSKRRESGKGPTENLEESEQIDGTVKIIRRRGAEKVTAG